MKLLLIPLFLMLASCASPSRELYNSVGATCPRNCAGHWTNKIEVYADFMRCVCTDE